MQMQNVVLAVGVIVMDLVLHRTASVTPVLKGKFLGSDFQWVLSFFFVISFGAFQLIPFEIDKYFSTLRIHPLTQVDI